MKDLIIRETDNKGGVVMGGVLTIVNAGLIRDRLLELMEQCDQISVTVEEGAEGDTSFLQMLCSANLSASRADKHFRLERVPETFIHTACSAGFTGRQGCICENNCLWEKGGEQA